VGTSVLFLAAALACLSTGGAAVLAWRWRRAFDARLDAETRRIAADWAALPELAASLDPNGVLEHTLEAVAGLPGVAAALLVVDEGGEQRTEAHGLTPEDAERLALQTPPNNNLRAMEVSFQYRLTEVGEGSSVPSKGLVVPLRVEDGTIGSLTAICGDSGAACPEGTVDALEAIARRAGPAFLSARRYSEARQQADFDSLTGLHNRRCFHECLEREVARAHRYDRRLSLIMLDLDNFKGINDRIGHLAGDTVLAEVGERIKSVVRVSDIPSRVGGDEFAVILPESGRDDAERLAARIADAVAEAQMDQGGRLLSSAGVAELAGADSALELFERADQELYRAKDRSRSRHAAS
jgi:diguanylate cyclase (GGDEF)-like protein